MDSTEDNLEKYNWNTQYNDNGIVYYYLTDFYLKDRNDKLVSLLFDDLSEGMELYLHGNETEANETTKKVSHKAVVSSYVIDMGRCPNDPRIGFWMMNKDQDVRYKLVYPAANHYTEYAAGILELAYNQRLLENYIHIHETQPCYHMTNFSLTDEVSGSSQTLILPINTKKTFVLKGSIKINTNKYSLNTISAHSQYNNHTSTPTLNIQTYVKSNYFVDFGQDCSEDTEPIFWVAECNYNMFIKLITPCHIDYHTDFEITMNQTIKYVQGYNWCSEDDEIWRHIKNFRLTDLYGKLHGLEITDLEDTFILWGDLIPPITSKCPEISIKLYVTTFSVDLGRESNDPNKGVWMGDVKGDWYKLVTPFDSGYQIYATPTFYKAEKFLEFYDALVYQNEDLCQFNEDIDMLTCSLSIKKIYKHANPKFDLDFVCKNTDFVLDHLKTNISLEFSSVLVNSIKKLRGK